MTKETEDEIDQYVKAFHAKLKDPNTLEREEEKISSCNSYYQYAQLLCSINKQKEALPYYQCAWDTMRDFSDDETYAGLVYSIGSKYATLLDYLGMIEDCDKAFYELNRIKQNGFHVGDYAFFLHRRKRDYDLAEIFYKKSLSLFPDHSSMHLKYAGFLRHVKKDLTEAEHHYKLAVEVNPHNADALGSYASFLHGIHRNIDEARTYYQKAAEADDTHANNLCNYGLFLSEEKHNFDDAERYYRRVLQFSPKHTNTLYNLAVLLDTHLKKRVEAEAYYRMTLEIEPRHAFALYNIAVLLEELHFAKGQDEVGEDKKGEIATLYKRAVEADPRDSATMADYGRYMFMRVNNIALAEQVLQTALKIDERCECALYHLAILLHRERKNTQKASTLLQKLLNLQPTHANGLLAMARLLTDRIKASELVGSEKEKALEDCVQLYEQLFTLHKEPELIVAEYLRLVESYGSVKMKVNAIKSMAPYVSKRIASGDVTSTSASDNALSVCRNLIDQIQKSVS